MGDPKTLPRSVEEIPLHLLGRGVSDAVRQGIQPAVGFLELDKQPVYLGVV
jgi:hypothetical protein